MTGTLLITNATPDVLRAVVESAAKSLKLQLTQISDQTVKARRGHWLASFWLGYWVVYGDFNLTFVSPGNGMSHLLFEFHRPWWTPWWSSSGLGRMKSLFGRLIDTVENSLKSASLKVARSEVVVGFEPAVANLQELEARPR